MQDPGNAVNMTFPVGVIVAKNFIIIEPDPVVCMDVEGMLIAEYPACHVACGSSLAEIGAALNNCGPDTTLFIRGSLISESADLEKVVQTAATRGSHIVIIGEAEDFDFPVTLVELPFTTDMVIAAVAQNAKKADVRAAE